MGERDVAKLLTELDTGQPSAVERLLPLVYEELRGLARGLVNRSGGGAGMTLQPTALVNEACIRMLGGRKLSWNDRAHFVAIAAMAMRQILASHARTRRAAKRTPTPHPAERVTLSDAAEPGSEVDLLVLDEALERLASLNARHARLIELRFFGGLSMEEAAEVMGVSVSSAQRDWRAARAWLNAQLGDSATEPAP